MCSLTFDKRNRANGVVRFLLARLHIDSLLDKKTKKKVMSTLDNLARGSSALDEAYGEAIKRIDGQLPGDRKLAQRVLSWMTYARRLLTTQEVCHALAVEPGDIELDEDNMPDVEDVVSVCAGLVAVDEESKIIRLVHYTTQEFLERVRLEWSPNAPQEIASTCLIYLSLESFRCGSCNSDSEFEERARKSIFLDYAARHWAEHVRPIEETVSELALAFLRDGDLVSCNTQVISVGNYKYSGYSQIFPQATTGLHLSARFGLVSLSRILLTVDCKESSTCADPKDSYGRTPLSWAAQNGHKVVVKLLLETGKADVESKGNDGWTALSRAASNGHEAIVNLLELDRPFSYTSSPPTT